MALSQGMSRTRVCVVVSRETAGFEFMRGITSSCSRSGCLWLGIFVAFDWKGRNECRRRVTFAIELYGSVRDGRFGACVARVGALEGRRGVCFESGPFRTSGLAKFCFPFTSASTDASHFNRQRIDCDVTLGENFMLLFDRRQAHRC